MKLLLLAAVLSLSGCSLYESFPAFRGTGDVGVRSDMDESRVIRITSPTETFVTNGEVPIQISVIGEFDRVELLANDEAIQTLDVPYTFEWDTTPLVEGSFVVAIRGTHEDGIVLSNSVEVIVDRTAPRLIGRYPVDGASADANEMVEIEFDETIVESQPLRITVADTAPVFPVPVFSDGKRFSFPVTWEVGQSVQFSVVTATDLAGNTAERINWGADYPEWFRIDLANPGENLIVRDVRLIENRLRVALIQDSGTNPTLVVRDWESNGAWVELGSIAVSAIAEELVLEAKLSDDAVVFSTATASTPATIRYATLPDLTLTSGNVPTSILLGMVFDTFEDNNNTYVSLIDQDQVRFGVISATGFQELVSPTFPPDIGTLISLAKGDEFVLTYRSNNRLIAIRRSNNQWTGTTLDAFFADAVWAELYSGENGQVVAYPVSTAPAVRGYRLGSGESNWATVHPSSIASGSGCCGNIYRGGIEVLAGSLSGQVQIRNENQVRQLTGPASAGTPYLGLSDESLVIVYQVSGGNVLSAETNNRIEIWRLNGSP